MNGQRQDWSVSGIRLLKIRDFWDNRKAVGLNKTTKTVEGEHSCPKKERKQ
jgi:hypothetical protein